jgi:hypothetical protein
MENKLKRYLYLKEELEKAMPTVIVALGAGFYPANFKMLETMALEFEELRKGLDL